MSVSPVLPRLAAVMLCAALLAGCQSSEEKAEAHFESAQQLLAEGDGARALVELRNVLSFNPEHVEGRRLLSQTMEESGDLSGAYANYLALVEQLPGDLEARLAVARIQLSQSLWAELAQTVAAAERIKADDPRVVAFGLVRDYQAAVQAGNDVQTASIARRAEMLLAMEPDDLALLRIVIDRKSSAGNSSEAAALIERSLALVPQDYALQNARLRLLIEAEDGPAVVAQMDRMMALFPQDEVLPAARLQWHLTRGETAEAEAFLRQRAGAPTGETQPQVELVEFLRVTAGPEAALAELDRLITANAEDPKADLYRALRASITFETADRAAALAELADIVAKATSSDQTRSIKALYANLLNREGAVEQVDALVADILKEDASHQEALMLRAARFIAQDRPGQAIVDLRAALNQAPTDARVLSALATAYLRDGNTDLATETMARAVEAAPGQPALARDYARLLQDLGRAEVAQAVVYDAWQRNLGDPGLIEMLSSMALAAQDWQLAAEILGVLRGSPTEEGLSAADQFESTVLQAQDRFDEALAIIDARLARAAEEDSAGGRATWTLLKTEALIRAERRAEAVALLSQAVTEMPEFPALRHRQAELAQEDGRTEEAIGIYRALIAANAGDERAVRILYGILSTEGQTEEAKAVLAAGLTARPDAVDLRWVEASRLQEEGDIAGAVAIYEALYARDSGNPIIANNLASLLATLSDDPETLDRAARIARRLRASEVPAFQDTHGWTLHRTGKSAEALPFLEAAAAGLSEDGSVHYHLGAVLAALDRRDEARAALERAVALGQGSAQPFVARAEALLAELDAPAPAPAATPAPAPATGNTTTP